MGFYRDCICPRLLDIACAGANVRAWREKVVPRAQGRVLDVGAGSGLNLPLLGEDVTHVTCLDPSARALAMAARRAKRLGRAAEFVARGLPGGGLEGPYDSILLTFSLCTIPEPAAALADMRRLLAPGGALLFVEHGLSPDEGVQRWQHRLERPWKAFAGGCHITRPIAALIEGAGFAITRSETGYESGAPRALGYMTAGVARVS